MRSFRSCLAVALTVTLSAGAATAGEGPAAAGSPGAASVPTAVGAADRLHASAAVPDEKRRVGTVRLVSRGGAVVVETLLETRLLSRVVAEIRAREKRSWGEDDASSRAYLEALESALARVAGDPDAEGGRRRLLIEVAADASTSRVSVGTYGSFDAASAAPPVGREVFATLDLPREWVLREIRLVVADSFDVPEGEADRIGPLRPAGGAP